MRFFNLDEYLKDPSKKVVTRDGRSVRIVCTDVKGEHPIMALITDKKDNSESPFVYTKNGRYFFEETNNDLFFAPIKREGWVNIYDITRINCISRIYKTKEEAETIGKGCKSGYITTTKIEWKE